MASIQIIFGLLITALFAARAFSVKIGTAKLDSRTITLSSSLFLIAVTAIMAIIMEDWFTLPRISDTDAAIAVICAVIKGIAIYFTVKFLADVAKESNSSSVFAGFISLGIAAPINSYILGEGLTAGQLIACSLLSLLGFVFFSIGPASELKKSGRRAFVFVIIAMVVIIMMDRMAIPRSGWFFYFALSNLVFFLFSFTSNFNKGKLEFRKNFSFPIMWAIGIIYTLGEIVVIYSYEEILPVTIGSLFIRLASPIVMVASAYLYKESKPSKQLAFGLLAILLAIPILL